MFKKLLTTKVTLKHSIGRNEYGEREYIANTIYVRMVLDTKLKVSKEGVDDECIGYVIAQDTLRVGDKINTYTIYKVTPYMNIEGDIVAYKGWLT